MNPERNHRRSFADRVARPAARGRNYFFFATFFAAFVGAAFFAAFLGAAFFAAFLGAAFFAAFLGAAFLAFFTAMLDFPPFQPAAPGGRGILEVVDGNIVRGSVFI